MLDVRIAGWALAALIGCGGVVETGGADTSEPREAGSDAGTATIVPTDEATACEAVQEGFTKRGLELGCPTTTRSCPDYLRIPAAGGEACLLYDEASVRDCLAIYAGATGCEELYAGECFPRPIEGTAPEGCATGT